jgi:hypothetical protein
LRENKTHVGDTAMTANWYMKIDNEDCGPVTFATLEEYAEKGRITPDTLVREGTDGEWVFARDVNELLVLPPGPPPAVPSGPKSASRRWSRILMRDIGVLLILFGLYTLVLCVAAAILVCLGRMDGWNLVLFAIMLIFGALLALVGRKAVKSAGRLGPAFRSWGLRLYGSTAWVLSRGGAIGIVVNLIVMLMAIGARRPGDQVGEFFSLVDAIAALLAALSCGLPLVLGLAMGAHARSLAERQERRS